MKRTTIKLLLLSTLILTQSACSKKDNLDKIKIEEKNLTPCQPNKTCQYLFTENADIDGHYKMNTGSYRLFWASQKSEGIESVFYIRTPMKGDNFELGKTEILRGDVKYLNICPACNTIPLKAVDGYVKGVNLTPGKQADQTKWLLEMQIVLQAEGANGTTETVSLKQIYYPNFVYN
ncbi:MAG TPA: hypothetical protein VK541_24605 [Pedobacter sp.]|uniref:hypothetical protein n=1 Tax=Pedobacter sp. TaxID=1411316 RepID=UPI002D13E313|nr:hypothetical protein [Pedobacter sp.]HMI05692.1 hypothetical protein [Pedobacter sp.]